MRWCVAGDLAQGAHDGQDLRQATPLGCPASIRLPPIDELDVVPRRVTLALRVWRCSASCSHFDLPHDNLQTLSLSARAPSLAS